MFEYTWNSACSTVHISNASGWPIQGVPNDVTNPSFGECIYVHKYQEIFHQHETTPGFRVALTSKGAVELSSFVHDYILAVGII